MSKSSSVLGIGPLFLFSVMALLLLGGGKILLIGNVIEQAFKQSSSWNVGSGLSLVLMIFIIASMAIVAKYDKDGEGTAF